jgi:hypothetical protein
MTSEPIRWWEVEDFGGWPQGLQRPSMYLDDTWDAGERPLARRWQDPNFRLRPHP